MLQACFSVTIVALTFSLQSVSLEASELDYQEQASEIILASLKSEPERSFLRKLYKELLFTPVWMRERSLSPAAKELFAYIRNDVYAQQKWETP